MATSKQIQIQCPQKETFQSDFDKCHPAQKHLHAAQKNGPKGGKRENTPTRGEIRVATSGDQFTAEAAA